MANLEDKMMRITCRIVYQMTVPHKCKNINNVHIYSWSVRFMLYLFMDMMEW
jgi:hypothetical protein